MKHNVMGLDLSLTASAYHDGADCCGLIKTKFLGAERLQHISNCIFHIVELESPQLVVVEDYAYGARGHAFSIGELGGLIKLGLFERGFRVLLVTPTSLKKFVTNKGNSPKDIMMLQTFKKYGVEFTDNNLCDAYGLAQVGKAYLGGTEVKYEKEVLKKTIVYC